MTPPPPWRVVVADRVAKSGLELLSGSPEIEVVDVAGKAGELDKVISTAHALIVRSETRVTAQLMAHAPSLRVVARAGTGVDTIDVPAATRRGIAVMNTPGANTVSAGEHAMGLLLALVRRISDAAAAMKRGEWDRKRFEGTELRGKTMGVVGLGRIGAHVAQLARAFGMQVIGHDPYLPVERAAELHVRLLPIDDLLRQADVVTLHVALTDQTHHLIDANRLKLMKPTAVLINTARGELVDEAALAEAITAKRIGGAAIDVFAVEPLPADSPLRGLDRVILTPHLAASTAEAQERVATEVCGAVREALVSGDLSFALNVPGMGGELLRRLAPVLDLSRRLGRLAFSLADGPVKAVEVAYGGKEEAAQRPVLVSALEGLLSAMNAGPVSLVNAQMLAEEKGIKLGMKTGAPEAGFETSIGVKVDTAKGRVRVAGALIGDSHGRVIRIDDYHVDVAPDGWMLIIRNRDVPGVIGRVGSALGSAGINIASYHQARRSNPSGVGAGDALAAINVDQALTNGVIGKLQGLQDVLEVRLANFGA
ncbi:MAG TPA: phosphoglycerate dehydrogenase [Gemmatimonadales bacterium]|nr:phosphoglycerate dehydrogenase [Gemmatimonadales bacterium]